MLKLEHLTDAYVSQVWKEAAMIGQSTFDNPYPKNFSTAGLEAFPDTKHAPKTEVASSLGKVSIDEVTISA